MVNSEIMTFTQYCPEIVISSYGSMAKFQKHTKMTLNYFVL